MLRLVVLGLMLSVAIGLNGPSSAESHHGMSQYGENTGGYGANTGGYGGNAGSYGGYSGGYGGNAGSYGKNPGMHSGKAGSYGGNAGGYSGNDAYSAENGGGYGGNVGGSSRNSGGYGGASGAGYRGGRSGVYSGNDPASAEGSDAGYGGGYGGAYSAGSSAGSGAGYGAGSSAGYGAGYGGNVGGSSAGYGGAYSGNAGGYDENGAGYGGNAGGYGGNAGYGGSSSEEESEINVYDFIQKFGYPAKNYTVRTVDGYLLDLIRIPHGVKHNSGSSYSQSSESDESSASSQGSKQQYAQGHQEVLKRAVLLMPGLISSADDYVLGGPDNGLAFMLADRGYDVYLGNVRGSKYGRKHTTLDPDSDAQFWKYCWDDIAMKDLPAIVDYVMDVSRMPKIYYVGHMEGATLFYILMSELPEYNDKVRTMITLGPMSYLRDTENLMVKLIAKNMDSKGWVVRNLGTDAFKPSQDLIRDGGGSDCMVRYNMNTRKMCKHIYFLINGYNSNNLNMTTISPILSNIPMMTGVSVMEMLQLATLHKTGGFSKYCIKPMGSPYNLDKITTPMVMFYAPNDQMSSRIDVEKLAREMKSLRDLIQVPEFTNNLDFLFANHVNIAYEKVIHELDK